MSKQKNAQGLAALIGFAIVVVLAAVAIPFVGGRNLVRGYDRSPHETLFLTVILNLALIALGCVVGAYALGMLFSQNSESGGTPNYGAGIGISLLSAFIGMIWGYFQRATRLEAFSVTRDNTAFLRANGFSVVGADDVTYYDANKNPLRYMETRSNTEIYMAVGRRNKRAYIELDNSGRMVRYTGVVEL